MGLSIEQIDRLKEICMSVFKSKDYTVHLDTPISDDIQWRPHIYAKNSEEFILDILTTENLPQNQIKKYIEIRNRFPNLNVYLAVVGDSSYSYSGMVAECYRLGIGIFIINGKNLSLLIPSRTATIEQIRSEGITVIAPNKPYGNILALKKCFRECKEYLHWLERNLPKKVFEIIYEGLKDGDIDGVGEVKLLRGFDETVDERYRSEVERLRGELVDHDVNVELRVICSKKVSNSIHGRFIYTKGQQFQLPPLNSILANQWDNIFKEVKFPPFEEYWKHGLDIVSQWTDIQRNIKGKEVSSKVKT
jgi:hypothetical protein